MELEAGPCLVCVSHLLLWLVEMLHNSINGFSHSLLDLTCVQLCTTRKEDSVSYDIQAQGRKIHFEMSPSYITHVIF